MNWHAVPVAILAGITGYAAILFLGLYFSLAKVAKGQERREYLTFALTCLFVVAYDAASVGLYNAWSIEQGFFWMRNQQVAAVAFSMAYMVFAWDFQKRPMPLLLRRSTYLLGVLGVLLLWESEYTLTLSKPAVKHIVVFQHNLIYYEVEPGVVSQVLLLIFFLLFATNLTYLLRYFRSRDGRSQPGRYGFLLAVAVAGVTATNDFLVTGGAYTFLYTFEYGITAILMSMGYVLLMRFGALHEAVSMLNRNLQATNADLVIALEQARESVKTKTEFLASISHELRTPLNAIINLPEGLIDEFATLTLATCPACAAEFQLDDGEQLSPGTACEACGAGVLEQRSQLVYQGEPANSKACLHTVARASRHLLGLVNSILDASKLELGRAVIVPAEFDPLALVSEIVASSQPLADKAGVSLRFAQPANDVAAGPIVADRVRIGQVLYNLINNAIKFSHEGGVVDVSLSSPSPTERELCVRDHGIGIAKEHHAMIFEKFRQVDGSATRAFGGTGLGLAISKGLVELHGGKIWVESSAGQGAAFYVRLPDSPPRRMAS